MRRRVIALMLAAAALLGGFVVSVALGAPPACTDTYTGSGDWSTAANWSSGVPTASDVACWGSAATLTVSTSGPTADSVQGGALMIVSGGSLSLTSSTNGSSLTGLTINGGSLDGGNGTLSLAGDFDWNVANNTTSFLGSSSGLAISQTGSHSVKIEGAGSENWSRGSISTPNPVSITNTNFSPGNFPGPSVTTTSTVTFAAGAYSGANFTMTAAGIVTPTGAVSGQYSLDLTGTSSDVKGDLTLTALSSETGSALSIPTGHVLTAGGGTISGTISGLGSYVHNGTAQEIATGGTLSPAAVTSSGGQLTVDSGATFSPGSTTVSCPDPANPGRLEIDDSGAATGPLTITGGGFNGPRLIGSGKLTVAGDFDWNIPSGAVSSINDTSPNSLIVAQTGTHTFKIEGSGTASIGGGLLTTPNDVSITNPNLSPAGFPGGALTTTGVVSFAPGSYGGGNFAITAKGVKTSGGAVSTPYGLDLTGSSSSLGGDLGLGALSVDAGQTLTVPSGDTVSAGGGTISGTVNGPGTFNQNGGPTTVASGGSLATGAVTSTAGQLTIDSGAAYSTGSTTVNTTDGSTPGRLEIDDNNASTGALAVTGGSFNGPRLNGSGTLTVAGDFDWTTPSGAVSGINDASPNTLTIAQTGVHSFKIEGPGTEFLNGGTLTTPNPVTISNPNFTPTGVPGPNLTTTSTVTFTHAGSYSGGNLTLTANGVVLAAGGTTLHDTFDLTGGSTSIPSGSSLTGDQVNESGGTLQVDGTLAAPVSVSGGTLKGTGAISGSLSNPSGTVAPGDSPGTLSVSGDYTQGSSGTLAIPVNGTAGGQFSVLSVAGNVNLDGTLALQLSNAYAAAAAPGDTIPFLSFPSGSRSGTFATMTVTPPLGNPQNSFQADYGPAHAVNAVLTPPPPANSGLPVISGTPQEGQTLHTTDGTWANNPTSFDYQWEDCDSAGNNCSDTGTDSNDYTLSSGDVGHTIRVIVTAHNVGGQDQATADHTAVVTPAAPSNTGLPVISGTAQQGQTLHTSDGTWNGNPSSFDYQWEDCNSSGAACSNVGADSNAYTLTAGDVGHTIRVIVTAHNGGGQDQATSDQTGVVTPLAPVNTGLPVISGTAKQGQTLHTTDGTWSNNPTSFDYQWEDCDGSGAACANVGADSNAYSLSPGDVGHTIRVIVTAHNAGGQGQATAIKTATVAALAPTNSAPPRISGIPKTGKTLTCSDGSWSPAPTRFSYQWNRDGQPINGATSSTYVVQPADQGHTLTCTVTAFNGAAASSPSTSQGVSVADAPPTNTSPPTITGTPLPGNTLTCHPGTWTGNPTSFDYQWDRNTSQLPGATQQQYQVQIADEGATLGCGVSAGNGSAVAKATVVVAEPGTLSCPKPSGHIGGLTVGPLALGMKQASARSLLHRFAVTRNHFDDFCLFGGWGIRVGYPSARLLRTQPRGHRAKLAHRIVIALTANPFYALDGIRPGAPLADAERALHLSRAFHIGLNDWYVARRPTANGVLKVRHGVVQEVGLLNKRLTRTRTAQGHLLISFR